MSEAEGELVEDINGKWLWKTATGRQIAIENMADSHLRNAALFLMGMGYAKCIAPDNVRVVWLRIFRIEWERRQLLPKKWHTRARADSDADECLEELDGTSSGFASRLLRD
jgi:hypothetical protein